MERYYIPSEIIVDNETQFGIIWTDNSYCFHAGCIERPVSGLESVECLQINPWGFQQSIQNINVGATSSFLVGSDCPVNDHDAAVVDISRSIFDTPNFSPFEPIYFVLFGFLSIWLVTTALQTILGKGWK